MTNHDKLYATNARFRKAIDLLLEEVAKEEKKYMRKEFEKARFVLFTPTPQMLKFLEKTQ